MAQKKPKVPAEMSGGTAREKLNYPPEAYTYDDDVTPAAVEFLRQRVTQDVSKPGWKVIDGFGTVVNV